jgi:hypothetical protein
LRAAILVLILAAAVLVVWRPGEQPVRALRAPEVRAAPDILRVARSSSGDGGGSERSRVVRIGSFERPENVPQYRILEKTPTGSHGARAAWLLVDTRSRSREDFTLITRDIKARYADYDVVSIEFTDTSEVLDYLGGAIVFNTLVGAERAGFIYASPNSGYIVRVAE